MRSTHGRLAVFAVLSTALVFGEGCRKSASTNPPPGDRNLITQAMMGGHRFNTAYEAVESLRSNWLNTRGTDSFQNPSYVRVYLDNVSLGDKETLRTIAIQNVVYIKYFDGISATARWGLDHGAGVIYVSTRPAGRGDPQA